MADDRQPPDELAERRAPTAPAADDVVLVYDEEEDGAYFAYLDRLDDDSGWTFEVLDRRLPGDVFHGTAESVDEALAEIRRIIAAMLNVDESSFDVEMLARIDEVHARMLDGLHNIGGELGDRHRTRPPS